MRLRRSIAAAVGAAIVLMAVSVHHVGAFELSNCNLIVQSFDASGEPLDTAIGDDQGGEGGTRDDPLLVDYEGTVRYDGDTGDLVITDLDWAVNVFLIPTPLRGSGPNDEQETTLTDDIDVSSSLPVRVSGLFFVSGSISGKGGSCRGHAWFRILGEPATTATTIPFWTALLIIGAGLLLLLAARPSLLVPGGYREVR